MRTALIGAAVAAGMALSAGSAQALVYTVVYTGQIAPGGYDGTGFFGSDPFVGRTFTLTYKVDTDTAGAAVALSGLTASKLEGSGAANPVLSAVFKIGSQSIAFGDTYGYDRRYDNALAGPCPYPCEAGMEQFARTTFFDNVAGVITSRSIGAAASAYGYSYQFSGRDHYDAPPSDASHFFGNFSANEYTIANSVKTQKYDISANFKGVSYTVSVAPEPGAWALMILGFGGVGAALRRRSAHSLP